MNGELSNPVTSEDIKRQDQGLPTRNWRLVNEITEADRRWERRRLLRYYRLTKDVAPDTPEVRKLISDLGKD